MNKLNYLALILIAITLNGCFGYMLVGDLFRLGFKMGIYSVFIIIGLIIWIINKRRSKRR